jgi:NAD(P)-dependent dehydrogenase (short-subunit alcohol dehydrogenase family)
MESLADKVAVVTGGASGIGRALVHAFAAERMKVVVADIEQAALDTTVAELVAEGADAVGLCTDVTDADSVNALADVAFERYGAVHVLCNNAGVGPPSAKVWETTPNDWRWTFSVNVFGVANGITAFVPRMLASGENGIVINTSSTDGPISPLPQASVYAGTKAAVTVLTECLDVQLREASEGKLRAAVFYPSGGLLDTGLWTSDRNRPAELARERPRPSPAMTMADLKATAERSGRQLQLQPLDELAHMVVAGIKQDRFVLIMPSANAEQTLHERAEKIGRGENPTTSHKFGG